MTTREKFIVGAMCLAIVYGAYDLMGSRKPKRDAAPAQANPAGELKKFVVEVTQKLMGEKQAKKYEHMISQAGAQWTKDPFLQSSALLKQSLQGTVSVEKPVTIERAPAFLYTGFMQIGDTRMAILNGIEYSRGESLNVNNYYVKEIHPNRVVIGRVNGMETFRLPLAEDDSANGK